MSSDITHARASRAPTRRKDVVDVNRVLRTIRQVRNGTHSIKKGGRGGKYLVQRTLHYSGYKLLLEELAKAENQELLADVKDQIHFDYMRRPFEEDKQLVIHKPSAFRRAMAREFNATVITWLAKIADGELCKVESTKVGTMRIATEIMSALTKPVECGDDRLAPDLSFTCTNCMTADMVVEIAWSDSNLNSLDRVIRFIHGTNGAVRTVVRLNMNRIYRGGRCASFSVWEAVQDGDEWWPTTLVDNKMFVDEKGKVISNCKLSLSLKDFICAKRMGKFWDFEDVPLEIPSTKLYEFYQNALTEQIADEAMKGVVEVQKKADGTSEKILSVEKIILDKRTGDNQNHSVMGKAERADIRAMISEVEDEVGEMSRVMDDVAEMMENRIEQMNEVEENRIEAENRVDELETQLANLRAEEKRIIVRGGRRRGRRAR